MQPNGICLFVVDVDEYSPALPILSALLQNHEVTKANSFLDELSRRQYIIGRAITRVLLSKLFREKPQQINISLSKYGKPFCQDSNGQKICFNVSHSYKKVLIAIGLTDIGVDIEKIMENLEFDDIANQCFSDEEISDMRSSLDSRNRFYCFWTRKEALLKATGIGIIDNLPAISCLDGLNNLSSDLIKSDKDWFVNSLEVCEGYAISIASDNQYNLQFYNLNAEYVSQMIQ